MSLLSCTRRHRALYRSAQRAVARHRHQHQHRRGQPGGRKSGLASSAPGAVVALGNKTRTSAGLAKTAAIRSASSAAQDGSPLSGAAAAAGGECAGATALTAAPKTPLTSEKKATEMAKKATEMAKKTADTANERTLEHTEQADAKPQEQQSWSAMFLALLAMIQPEWAAKDKAEEVPLEEICITQVAPQVSDVLSSADRELFWRYDTDSYAANRHNEDRAQYVLDAISRPGGGGEETRVFFCGCYDGHGGEEAVDFVHKKLYAHIRHHLTASDQAVAHALLSGFKDTEEEFKRRSRVQFQRGAWSACSVGACAVVALVLDQKLYVASCGDCRAILAFREPDGSLSVEQVTFDHSANEEKEQRRLRVLYPDDYDIVCEIGRQNFYVKGRLQPTRSIGDTYMKVKEVNRAPMPRGLRIHGSFRRPYISAVPDVFQVDLQARRPEFLVLGSDGLFGELKNDEIVQLVGQFRAAGVANASLALREAVLERVAGLYGTTSAELANMLPGYRRDYHDDITIDVLHFAPPAAEEQADAA